MYWDLELVLVQQDLNKNNMCKCGCNTCETKGPLLTEGKVKSLLSEGLQYHIDKKIPLFETVYRIGSDKHLSLIKEARKMYSRNIIDLCEDDEALIKTHLGEFALYKGEAVPLDLPMLEQTYSGFIRNPEDPDSKKFEPTGVVAQFKEDLRALFGKFKGDLKNPEFIKGVAQIMVNWKSLLRSQMDESKYEKEETIQQTIDRLKARIDDPNDGGNVPFLVQKIKDLEKSLNESYDYDEVAQSEFGMDYDQLGSGEKEWVRDEIDNMSMNESNSNYPDFDLDKNIRYQDTSISSGMWRYTGQEQGGKGVYRNLNNDQILAFDRSDFEIFRNNLSSHFDFSALNEEYTYKGRKLSNEEEDRLDLIAHREYNDKDFSKLSDKEQERVFAQRNKVGVKEAKKAKKKVKKDPPLNKPKRGGSKAYYVYVRDPKTKKIKKVSFGSGGLRAKIKNKEARNAFAARHNCKNKKDRTKAGYWSCNLPRYAPALGLGAKMNTFW